jgi:hypothetical protein
MTTHNTLVQLWGDGAGVSGHNAWCFTDCPQLNGISAWGIRSIHNGKLLVAVSRDGRDELQVCTCGNQAISPTREHSGG